MRLIGDALGVGATGVAVALALGVAPVWTTDELQLVASTTIAMTSGADRITARG